MQPILEIIQIKLRPPPNALPAESRPFVQNFPDSHDAGHPAHEDIKIAGKAVFKRRHAEQPLHQAIRIRAPFQVKGNFQTSQAGFIPDIRNFTEFSLFNKRDHFFNNSFDGRGRRNLRNINAVCLFVVGIA